MQSQVAGMKQAGIEPAERPLRQSGLDREESIADRNVEVFVRMQPETEDAGERNRRQQRVFRHVDVVVPGEELKGEHLVVDRHGCGSQQPNQQQLVERRVSPGTRRL